MRQVLGYDNNSCEISYTLSLMRTVTNSSLSKFLSVVSFLYNVSFNNRI